MVDAGHGGTDEGAHGSDGTLEKNVTLGVARRLRAALEARLGARVILTRTGDTVVPIDERAAVANNNKADLFISLHANSSRSSARRGAEVFHLSIAEYGAEAREVAEREAPVLAVVGGGAREIDIVEWEMAQARHVDHSARLAELVEDELRQRVPMSPRAMQQAPFPRPRRGQHAGRARRDGVHLEPGAGAPTDDGVLPGRDSSTPWSAACCVSATTWSGCRRCRPMTRPTTTRTRWPRTSPDPPC